ncbi:LPS assembly lipoprotein LptE [Pukyongiella litopenaei]|uniref:LPS-assembly lipoprotein n=1 Tax=Pukyongiella litopenaei TaxID=2605946 RepID=A0A2S0MQZ5_9RHOB|nr:LPS assembly lipoprotein LptE [Pukyongiella litopenaei]AVO38308.1 hypothetical protein C6Y53_11805 [Pukyongiella litopenaei]
MSLSDPHPGRRKALGLLALAPALAACGFTPVYAPGSTASTLRGRVEVAPPETASAYLLVEELEDRLGRAATPAYRLGFVLRTDQQGQAITASSEITRYSIVGRVAYELRPIGSDNVLASGKVRNFTGYSATGSTVETLAAERDATARLMSILADQIAAQLYATADLGT